MREHLYTVEWTTHAEKQFKKLTNKNLQEEILDIIENEIAKNPLLGKPLTFTFKGVRSYRLGRLRILYKQYVDHLIIVILKIEHRKSVYR